MADPRIIKGVAIGMASLGLALPAGDALAETRMDANKSGKAAPGASPIEDIALSSGGMTGRVVDGSGLPVEGAQVTLHQGKQLIGQSITDKSGTYAFKNLRAGVYQLDAAQSRRMIRVWKENAAPPGAKGHALVVTGQNRTRGQLAAMVPAHMLMAGGASAATAGALALQGGGGSMPMSVSSSSASNNAPSNNSAGNSLFAAPQEGSTNPSGSESDPPSSAAAVRISDPSLHQGIVVGDDSYPKYVICPAPYSP